MSLGSENDGVPFTVPVDERKERQKRVGPTKLPDMKLSDGKKEALAQTIEGLNLILTDPQASREERLKA